MSSVNERHGLLEDLERTENVLEGLLRKISNVNEYLSPLEHMLRAEDFSSTGSYIPGVSDGIVCMLPDNLRMDGKQHIEETAFLERWKEKVPTDILKNGLPFGIS